MKRFAIAALTSVIIAAFPSFSIAQDKLTTSRQLANVGISKTYTDLINNHSEKHMAIGFISALQALENAIQTRWTYDLGNNLRGLPLLRVNLPANPDAQKAAPDTLTNIFKAFGQDISRSRQSLQKASRNKVASFSLKLGDLWFDVDADGRRGGNDLDAKSILPLVLTRSQLRRFDDAEKAHLNDIVIDFDVADVSWLLAYTHALSGSADLFLAFDPAPIITDLHAKRAALISTGEETQSSQTDEIAELKQLLEYGNEMYGESSKLNKEIRKLERQLSRLKKDIERADDTNLLDKLTKEQNEAQARLDELLPQKKEISARLEEYRVLADNFIETTTLSEQQLLEISSNSLRTRVDAPDFSSIADLIYIITETLRQNPDADRIKSAHKHFKSVIAHNKTFWSLIALETDNSNEWIPNVKQTSALGVEFPEGIRESWQEVLSDAEKVLKGELLIAHPFFPSGFGFSVTAYVENPGPLDFIHSINGVGLYAYAQRGETVSNRNWRSFTRLTGRNANGFMLFFN